jgi:hypothetical protein
MATFAKRSIQEFGYSPQFAITESATPTLIPLSQVENREKEAPQITGNITHSAGTNLAVACLTRRKLA